MGFTAFPSEIVSVHGTSHAICSPRAEIVQLLVTCVAQFSWLPQSCTWLRMQAASQPLLNAAGLVGGELKLGTPVLWTSSQYAQAAADIAFLHTTQA